MPVKLSRRARWGVPAAGVAVTAAVVAGLQIPSAQASPTLPARTPAQLLAEVSTDASLPPLTGTMVESTSLGLPQLPQIGGATSLSSLLTGSHTLKIYYQDATAVPGVDPGAGIRGRPDQERRHRLAVELDRELGHQVQPARQRPRARPRA